MNSPYEALHSLNLRYPGTLLAGGYLRDALLGAPAKDADFFIPFGATVDGLKDLFPNVRKEAYSNWLSYRSDDISAVLVLDEGIGGLPLQAIVMKEGMPPKDRVSKFDFGFCQVASSAEGVLITTEAFRKDSENNTATLTYCPDEGAFERSMGRWLRLQKKYPSRQLVIPEEFQQWVKF